MAMTPMQKTFTAFQGHRRLVSGPAGEVALVIKRMAERPDQPIVIFEDATGRTIDFDLRGGDREVLARLAKLVPPPVEETPSPSEPRGRGRPRLGVVAREVTLLPRHWEWLNGQPGRASVALRKLVEEARRAQDGGGPAGERRAGPRPPGAGGGVPVHVRDGGKPGRVRGGDAACLRRGQAAR